MSKYIEVAQIKSQFSGKEYAISVDADANYACSCFAWVYNKGNAKEYGCKHIQEYLKNSQDKMVKSNPSKSDTKLKKLVKNKSVLDALKDLKESL